jgi:putative tricarboxylic transport membrane protein
MILLAKYIARLTYLRGHILAPLLLAIIVLGTYASKNNPMDVVYVFVFGALGYLMKELNYSRAPLILGFVLTNAIESYLHISLRSFGPTFFMRPISLIIIGLLVLGLVWPSISRRLRRGRGA